MKRLIVLLLGALALCLPPAPAAAQNGVQYLVVSACGTLTATPPIGSFYWGTMTADGKPCTSSTFAPSGTQNVSVVGPLGTRAAAQGVSVALSTADAANLATIATNSALVATIAGTDGLTIAAKTNPFDVELNGAIPAGANLIGGVQGAAANAASVAGNPLLEGCRGATAAPTAVTDGQVATAQCTADGKRVMLPYAIKELAVRGSTGAVTNTTQTSIIASAGGSLKNYITAIQCANSGATTSILTFTDAAATVLINPAGGGGSWVFPVPLATAAATAFQVTPGSSSTSQYCSAQGYTGL